MELNVHPIHSDIASSENETKGETMFISYKIKAVLFKTIIFLVVVLSTIPVVLAENWVLLVVDKKSDFEIYIDKDSIYPISKDVYRFHTISKVNGEVKFEEVEEINCKNKTVKMLRSTMFLGDGKAHTVSGGKKGFIQMRNNENSRNTLKMVCMKNW